MRLAVASPFLDRQHGTERCIVEQVERLALKYGWEVHLYSQSIRQVDCVCYSGALQQQRDGSIYWHKISSISGPHLIKYIWWMFANHLRRWFERGLSNVKADLTYSPGINCLDADVIVVHIVFHELYSSVSSDLRLRQVPISSWHLATHRKLYYQVAMFLEKRVYRNPRIRLVAVSNRVAQHLKIHFGRTDVAVIPNAVDTSQFTPEARLERRDTIRRQFSYSDEDFVLLLIGNDWANKGLDPLLRALDLLADLPLRLLVVGEDDPRIHRQLIARLFSQTKVRFERPATEVLSFYAAADAYVGPSMEDAFGLPIIEAMSCGLPVIASSHAGASELLREGETGLILSNPRDASEIARLIREIYTDSSLRTRLGRAAAHYVQTSCSWDHNVQKTRQLLEAILQDKQSG